MGDEGQLRPSRALSQSIRSAMLRASGVAMCGNLERLEDVHDSPYLASGRRRPFADEFQLSEVECTLQQIVARVAEPVAW